MDRIVLGVDDTTGRLYRRMDVQAKQRVDEIMGLVVKELVADDAKAKFSELLDRIAEEAERNGLTPEILESLLADND